MSREAVVRVTVGVMLGAIVYGWLIYWSANSGAWLFAAVVAIVAPIGVRAVILRHARSEKLPANTTLPPLDFGMPVLLKRLGVAFLRGLIAFAIVVAAGIALGLTGHLWFKLAGGIAIALAMSLCLMLYPVIRLAVVYGNERRRDDQSVPPEMGAT